MASYFTHYDSISDLRAMLDRPWLIERNRASMTDHTHLNRETKRSWFGIEGGYAAVAKALQKGFPEGERLIETMHQDLKAKLPKAVGLGRKLIKSDQGDELDIHAVNRGDISRAWSSRRRLIKRGKTSLRIVVDIGGNCGVNADSLRWRGVAGMCLAEIMTAASYKTEIVAGFAVRGHDEEKRSDTGVVTVTVKASGTAADKGLLAASLCLSGFFRTFGFAAVCRLADDQGHNVESCLGHSLQLETLIKADARSTQLCIPHSIRDAATAAAWVTATVKMLQGMTAVK